MASILFCVDLSTNTSWAVRFCLLVNVGKLNGSQRSEVFTVFLLLTADNLKHFCVRVMGVNTVLWPSKNISATCGVLCIVRWRTSELIIYDCKAFTVQDNVPVDKQYTVGLKNDEKSLQRFGDKGKAFEKGENGPTGAGWQVSCVGLIDFLFVVSVLAWPSYWNLYNCKLLRIMKKDSYSCLLYTSPSPRDA